MVPTNFKVMAQINKDFRHHLVNGLTGIRASEQNLKEGFVWRNVNGEYVKQPTDLSEELANIDYQLKRIFEALRKIENDDNLTL